MSSSYVVAAPHIARIRHSLYLMEQGEELNIFQRLLLAAIRSLATLLLAECRLEDAKQDVVAARVHGSNWKAIRALKSKVRAARKVKKKSVARALKDAAALKVGVSLFGGMPVVELIGWLGCVFGGLAYFK
jgi:hypothetical protein